MIKSKIAHAAFAHIMGRLCFFAMLVIAIGPPTYISSGYNLKAPYNSIMGNMYDYAVMLSFWIAIFLVLIMAGLFLFKTIRILEIIWLVRANKKKKPKGILKSLEKLEKGGYITKEEKDLTRKKVLDEIVQQ